MPIEEVLKKTTYRQYRSWMEYFERDLGEPGKTEWYLMQIAAEVANVLKRGKRINTDAFKLKFKTNRPKKLSPEEARRNADAARARWLGVTGAKKNGDRS